MSKAYVSLPDVGAPPLFFFAWYGETTCQNRSYFITLMPVPQQLLWMRSAQYFYMLTDLKIKHTSLELFSEEVFYRNYVFIYIFMVTTFLLSNIGQFLKLHICMILTFFRKSYLLQ